MGLRDDWLWSVFFHPGQAVLVPSGAGSDPGAGVLGMVGECPIVPACCTVARTRTDLSASAAGEEGGMRMAMGQGALTPTTAPGHAEPRLRLCSGRSRTSCPGDADAGVCPRARQAPPLPPGRTDCGKQMWPYPVPCRHGAGTHVGPVPGWGGGGAWPSLVGWLGVEDTGRCQLGPEQLSQAPGLPWPAGCCSKSLGSTRRAGSSGGCLLRGSELPGCCQWLLPIRCPMVRPAAAHLPLTSP